MASFSGTYPSARYGWDWGTFKSYYPGDTGGPPLSFIGAAPDDAAGCPVFVWVPDTTNVHDSELCRAVISRAAAKGFVAASVKFRDWMFSPGGIDANARAIFGQHPESVVSQLAGHEAASASRGLVVAGFSQGAAIAARAAAHHVEARAAWLVGFNEGAVSFQADSYRVVNGEHDMGRPEQRNADGSGWWVVQDELVTDGHAGHAYLHAAEHLWSAWTPPEARWVSLDDWWTLNANLDWLKGRTG